MTYSKLFARYLVYCELSTKVIKGLNYKSYLDMKSSEFKVITYPPIKPNVPIFLFGRTACGLDFAIFWRIYAYNPIPLPPILEEE